MKAFLDANVFIAAAGSPKGGSAFVLEFAKKGMFAAVTVTHALVEAERNIRNKMSPASLERHHANLLKLRHDIQLLPMLDTPQQEMLECMLPSKDIPILLGAALSGAGFLITLDKKDFLQNEKLRSANLPFKIMPPGEFLMLLTADL